MGRGSLIFFNIGNTTLLKGRMFKDLSFIPLGDADLKPIPDLQPFRSSLLV